MSKAVLDVMILPGESLQATDDAAGIREPVMRLGGHSARDWHPIVVGLPIVVGHPIVIGHGASGGYERPALNGPMQAGIRVRRIDRYRLRQLPVPGGGVARSRRTHVARRRAPMRRDSRWMSRRRVCRGFCFGVSRRIGG